MTTAAATPHCTTVNARPHQQQRGTGSTRTDLMIASSGLAACRAMCNLRVLRQLRHNYRRGVGERE